MVRLLTYGRVRSVSIIIEQEVAGVALCRPKVFFDTCVYSAAAKQSGASGITPRDWTFVNHYVENRYRVCVSWTTFKELLCRLVNCRDEFFVRNQDGLKWADRHGRAPSKFLEKPQIFAIQHTLGIDVRPKLDREGRPNLSQQKWSEGVLNAVFRARNKRELLGGVKLGPKTKMHGTFDLSDFAAFEEESRSEFVRLSEGWRIGQVDRPSAVTVAINLLQDSGLKPDKELSQKLSLALGAVNSTINWFWSISKNPSYSFEKHKNNWDDLQQLFYLCDPSMTFVTLNTNDFMPWTKNSTQSAQVISWQQFVENARRSVQAHTPR